MFTFIGFVSGAVGTLASWRTPRGAVVYTVEAAVLRASRIEHGVQAMRAVPGMEVSSASFRRATSGRYHGAEKSARKVDQYKADLNATAKAHREAYTILTNTKKVIGF